MSLKLPAKHLWRDDLIAVLLAVLWLVTWRAALGISWGFDRLSLDARQLDMGLLYNGGDTWSYLSWVRQYQTGSGLASLLYTAEPHQPLLWIFPLWAIGRFSALSGLPTIGVYNVASLVGAAASVWSFRRAAVSLGLGASARNWATVALLLGSGCSWIWHLAHKLGLAHEAAAPELFFLDLFPATTFLIYPYHALGLALLAALWWRALRLEARLREHGSFGFSTLSVVVLAGLLASSRPYEPLAFLGAWTLKTAWHGLRRRVEPEAWSAAWRVQLVLAAACAPGVAWTVWISTRPVWSTFAHESLSLGNWFSPLSWIIALTGWIVLAVIGLGKGSINLRQAILPVAATVLLVIIVVGVGSGHAKLASGLLLGPALLAGWAAERIVHALPRVRFWIRVPIAATLLFVLLGVPSLLLALQAIKLQPPPPLAPAVYTLAARLPVSPTDPPLVLAGPEPAAALPGLAGARVWAGHFSLTHHFLEKLARLRASGLDPSNRPSDQVAAARALDEILVEAPFQFALLDPTAIDAHAHLLGKGWTVFASADGWKLLVAPSRLAKP